MDKYQVRVTSNSINLIPCFTKIGQVFQSLKGHIYTPNSMVLTSVVVLAKTAVFWGVLEEYTIPSSRLKFSPP
jgi:hypothetical protein